MNYIIKKVIEDPVDQNIIYLINSNNELYLMYRCEKLKPVLEN